MTEYAVTSENATTAAQQSHDSAKGGYAPLVYDQDELTRGSHAWLAGAGFGGTGEALHIGPPGPDGGRAREKVPGQSGQALQRDLLERARLLVKDLDSQDRVEAALAADSLLATIGDLWARAPSSSRQHQAILAVLEGSLFQLPPDTPGLKCIVQEAVADLSSPTLSDANVDVLTKRFIRIGYDPMAFLGLTEQG